MKPATTLALVALATSLGGCKSFVQAFDFSRHSGAPQYAIGQGDLDEGRAMLRAGSIGNALAPLHRAALNPETSGEALNALGVAYVKLGRADLAERYFIAATRVDGGNERYTANLARFYRSDLARDAWLAHAQKKKAESSYASFAEAFPASEKQPEIDRRTVMSGGEARTITVSRAGTSQRIAVGKSGQAETFARPAPRVRVSGGELRHNTTQTRQRELRIATKPAPTVQRVRIGKSESTGDYPVRVKIAPRPTPSDQN